MSRIDLRQRYARPGLVLAGACAFASFSMLAPDRSVHAQATNRLVVAAHSGKCLDVLGWGTADAVGVVQWDCHGGQNQRWELHAPRDGTLELRSAHSGRCLDVNHGRRENGVVVQQWGCHGGAMQRWRLVPAGPDNMYEIVSESSGKCLDVVGGQPGNGTMITQWDCHHGGNQRWTIAVP